MLRSFSSLHTETLLVLFTCERVRCLPFCEGIGMHVHACIILSRCVGRLGSVCTIYVYTSLWGQQGIDERGV
jgi:hypothetical protein